MFAFLRSKSQPSSPRSESDAQSPKTFDNEDETHPTLKAEESNKTATNEGEKQTTVKAEESNKTATNVEQKQLIVQAEESNKTSTDEEESNRTLTSSPSGAAKSNIASENLTKQELEQYAVHKAEETTITVNNCLRIVEDLKGDATRTLEALHQQGEHVHKTHDTTATTDQDLKQGEKLLDTLGGIFSKSWKARKAQEIEGRKISPGPSPKAADKEDKQKLMAAPEQKRKKNAAEPANCYDKIEMEKAKQDDALVDLNNILGDLKGMAVDMGSELERQSRALDHLGEDIEELDSRVKGANERARKLVAN